MRIILTGGSGFIAKNLIFRLRELNHDVITVSHNLSFKALTAAVAKGDYIFHLAGVNRPLSDNEFVTGNIGFTQNLICALQAADVATPIVYASSVQATLDNPYGRSKLEAEDEIRAYGSKVGAPVFIFRLANVFGKWAKPNYNSAVATFCYNISRGLPITVVDPNASINLMYIDDVCDAFLSLLNLSNVDIATNVQPRPVYHTTVGFVADTIRGFPLTRSSLAVPTVGAGLVRALYSTYLSYISPDKFSYEIPRHKDRRGTFCEVLKTSDSGQFSYFTSMPGITRGEHYHHTKVEKFIVVKGLARFGFSNISTNEKYYLDISAVDGRVVETVPGWSHNITNIGNEELIVMLWANEVFERRRPDTISRRVEE